MFDVPGVNLVESEGPNEVFRLVAEHPLHRRAYVAHGALGLKDHHDVRRVLYQGAKPALTPGGLSGPSVALDPDRYSIRRVGSIRLCGVHACRFSTRSRIQSAPDRLGDPRRRGAAPV